MHSVHGLCILHIVLALQLSEFLYRAIPRLLGQELLLIKGVGRRKLKHRFQSVLDLPFSISLTLKHQRQEHRTNVLCMLSIFHLLFNSPDIPIR